MGISFVHIGNDNTLIQLLKIPSYYSDLLLSLSVVYLLGYYFRRVFSWIDKHCSIESVLNKRIKYQILLGLLVPSFFIVLTELVYLTIINIPLSKSSILYLELPVSLSFLIVINLIYVILYYHNYTSKLSRNKPVEDTYIIGKQGPHSVNVPMSKISYFFVKEKLTFVVTIDGRKLLIDMSLAELNKVLSPEEFFRINRQFIIGRNSLIQYTSTKTRRLKIDLYPPFGEDVFIAKKNTSSFKAWLSKL